jgi:hypothetical protein
MLDRSHGEISHRFPQFLRDGRHFVYVNRATEAHLGLYVGCLGSKETKRILTGKWSVAYSVGDYLLSVREGTLIAHPFNGRDLEVAGGQFSVAEHVASSSPSGFASFSASSSGVLVYASGSSPNRQLVWFSRDGSRLGPVVGVGEYGSPALAPNERTVAFARVDPQTRTPDIWLFDLARKTETRFTFDPGSDRAPLWSPDGREVMFASDRTGVWDLYKKSVNGINAEEPVTASADDESPSQWSTDARLIVYSTPRPNTNWDLWTLRVLDPSKPIYRRGSMRCRARSRRMDIGWHTRPTRLEHSKCTSSPFPLLEISGGCQSTEARTQNGVQMVGSYSTCRRHTSSCR